VSKTLLAILTIRRLLSNYYISINVGMDYVTISTATNSSFYAHQAVLLYNNGNTTNSLGNNPCSNKAFIEIRMEVRQQHKQTRKRLN
jgi:hypothetical protein